MKLTAEKVQAKLSRYKVHFYEQIDSTNDAAMEILSKNRNFAPNRSISDVLVADEQLKGKGRLGRVWYTPPETALIVSIILPLKERNYLSRVTMLGAVAIAEMIEGLFDKNLAEVKALPVGIKWPNDVQVNGKKVCGVLAEACWHSGNTSAYLQGVVLGMGVNVRTDFAGTELENTAISLEPTLGMPVDRLELLADLIERVNKWYQQIGTLQLLDAWKSRLNMLGKIVTVQQGSITGLAERVDDEGALWVRDNAGYMHRVIAGDIGLGES